MGRYTVAAPGRVYDSIIERGLLARVSQFVPEREVSVAEETGFPFWSRMEVIPAQ